MHPTHSPAALPALPDSPAATAALALVRERISAPAAHHSIRSYLFAVLLAERRGLAAAGEFDPELLFHACVLHDLGLSPDAPGAQRFEVEGADRAAEFLTGLGYGAGAVDQVWEAIALHASPGLAERRGPLALLTRAGIAADLGLGTDPITDAEGAAVHARHPRLGVARDLVEGILRHAGRGPGAAPPFSIAAELARERAESGGTLLERAEAKSRWAAY
ncbi:HD domain-containing protein [Kitasatospora sp. NPDC058965]|uniref:HD domain-containing protein n=1 Tax=Kitasatospora sp. NPDC058965 TaxID=3346682 RepID=UPI0036BC57C5